MLMVMRRQNLAKKDNVKDNDNGKTNFVTFGTLITILTIENLNS